MCTDASHNVSMILQGFKCLVILRPVQNHLLSDEALFINMADCGALAEIRSFHCFIISQSYNIESRQFMKNPTPERDTGRIVLSSILNINSSELLIMGKPCYNEDCLKELCIYPKLKRKHSGKTTESYHVTTKIYTLQI